jgi:hypothetical protein
MSEAEKEELRKLIMLISDLRAKDEERYEAHVNFMNETIKMIRAIENQMNKHWQAVLDSLKDLNEDINTSLDSLLTGINPKGLKETSQSLKEIMNTMNKSVQSMNLEKVLSEFQILQSGTYTVRPTVNVAQSKPEPITAGAGLTPPSLSPPGGLKPPNGAAPAPTSEEASEWVDPHEKKKKEEEEPHLLKPSDFFGS